MKSWLSSPLAINYLSSFCKNGPSYQKKYLEIYKNLKFKKEYISSSQLFLSPSFNSEKQYQTSDISVEKVDFAASKDVNQCIMKWMNQYGSFSRVNIEKYVLPSTTSLLCNISVFKDTWKCNQPSPVMKVHNSFSYTEDIRYDARLIELPMQDNDFKLIIIVPNEVSSISRLFSELVDEGLAAAVSCVQPLFTFSTILEAPCIEFCSEDDINISLGNCNKLSGVQIGNVHINENGTSISVVTVLGSTHINSIATADEVQSETQTPFHFAILYKDIAIFTGRYVKRVK